MPYSQRLIVAGFLSEEREEREDWGVQDEVYIILYYTLLYFTISVIPSISAFMRTIEYNIILPGLPASAT